MAENIVKSTRVSPGSLGILKGRALIQQLQEIVESFSKIFACSCRCSSLYNWLSCFFWMQKPERTTLYASLPEQEK